MQIHEKCRTAARNLHLIGRIRDYLTTESCHQLVLALVIAHIDYGNAIYFGLPQVTLKPLYRIQAMAAKLVLRKRKYDSVTEALIKLHWLPIKYRVNFKIACLVYQSLNGLAPSYLQELISVREAKYASRSSHNGILLNIPATKHKTFADRSFYVAGPKVWNGLPLHVREATNYSMFKKHLKTHYFKQAFNV